jgi:hypothetical protein
MESQKTKSQEAKEKQKVRREKLASYFFDVSKLVLAALVLGGITPLFINNNVGMNWYVIASGGAMTFLFAFIGNSILK